MATRVERAKEIVALQQQLEANNEQIEFAKRQLGELAGGTQRVERDAVIVVDKANAAAGRVRLNYLVGNVHWRPQYKLRAGKDKDPVASRIPGVRDAADGRGLAGRQHCAVHRPADAQCRPAGPEIAGSDRGAAGTPERPGGAASGRAPGPGRIQGPRQEGGCRPGTEPAVEPTPTTGPMPARSSTRRRPWRHTATCSVKSEDIRAVQREGEVNEGPSVTFHLKPKLTLPSRNDEQTLEIARIELTPDFYYKAVPVLSSNVYRQATWPTAAITSCCRARRPCTSAPISSAAANCRWSPSASSSRSASASIRSCKPAGNSSIRTGSCTGGNQVLTFDYRILVNSYKAEPVKVQVWDRLPKAEAQTMAISLTSEKPELSTDVLYQREDGPKNLLRWDVTVQPTQNGEKAMAIDYQFRLELDKNLQIGAVAAK